VSTTVSLRRLIETCELPHLEYSTHETALIQRIDDALTNPSPASEWMIGPSRVGKTMLVKAMARRYPATKVNGVRQVPVLIVALPQGVTPRDLPTVVMSAVGMALTRGSSSELFRRMARLLKAAGTKVVLFDEASHLVEPGSRILPRAAADWFKQFMDMLEITIILLGVPRLEKLYISNEQLRLRSQARIEFRPYDYKDREQRLAFAACIRTYVDMFAAAGSPIEIPFEIFVQHCYLLSGGLIGIVSSFLIRLALDLEKTPKHSVSFQDCRTSLAKVEVAGHPECPAFTQEDVTPIDTNKAYAHVMAEAGLPMRRAG
jgi:hypothetical protein